MLYTTPAYRNKCFYLYLYDTIQMEHRQKLQTFLEVPALNISELPSNALNDFLPTIIFRETQTLLNRAIAWLKSHYQHHSTLKLHQPFL